MFDPWGMSTMVLRLVMMTAGVVAQVTQTENSNTRLLHGSGALLVSKYGSSGLPPLGLGTGVDA